MQTAFMVTAGAYADYHVIRVFEDLNNAEQYAFEYNNDVPWSHEDDKARVEDVEFVPVTATK